MDASSTRPATPPLPRVHPALVIGILALVGLVVVSQLYVPIPLAEEIADAFGIPEAAVGFAGTLYGLGYAFGFLVFGPLSDAYGRKRVLVPGVAAFAAATLAVGVAPSWALVLAARLAQGFLAGTFAPAALAYVGEALPVRHRATGIAFISTGFLLAGVLGQVGAALLAQAAGWRGVFTTAAVVYLGAAALMALSLPALGVRGSPAALARAFRTFPPLMRDPDLLRSYGAAFTVLLTFVAMYAGLGPHLAGVLGAGNGAVEAARAAAIPSILLALLAGPMIARWGTRRVATTGFLVGAVGLVLEAAAGGVVAVALASMVYVAGIAIVVPALITLVADTAPDAKGAATALYAFVLFIGASLGPQVAVVLVPLGFGVLCLVLAALLVGAMALLAGHGRGPRTVRGGPAAP